MVPIFVDWRAPEEEWKGIRVNKQEGRASRADEIDESVGFNNKVGRILKMKNLSGFLKWFLV